LDCQPKCKPLHKYGQEQLLHPEVTWNCLTHALMSNRLSLPKWVWHGAWPVLSPVPRHCSVECHLTCGHAQNPVHYGQRRVVGHKCTVRGPPKPISLYMFSVFICCEHGCFHCLEACQGLCHPHGLKE